MQQKVSQNSLGKTHPLDINCKIYYVPTTSRTAVYTERTFDYDELKTSLKI